jgi:pantoate kinase
MPSVRDRSTTVGTAFAPGHITGLFAPRLSSRDPRGRGSVGAGLVLEVGVSAIAHWTPGAADRVTVHSSPRTPVPISVEAARRVKGERSGRLNVELTHALPIGRGFGMSAAGALATARAVANAVGGENRRVVEIAHLSDLFGGGGLGGVAAIDGGGLEIRKRPGIPPWGNVRRLSFPAPVFVAIAGAPLPSPDLLSDAPFLARVERAAADGLRALARHPSAETFLAESETFTDRLGLASPAMERRMHRLRSTGARVAQAMFGRTIFAVGLKGGSRNRLLTALAKERLAAVELSVLPPSSETL